MRHAILVLLLAGTLAAQATGGRGRPRSYRSSQKAIDTITNVMKDQQKAWNAGDAAALVTGFTDSADFTDHAGNVLADKAALQKYYAEAFRGPFKGSHQEFKVRQTKFVRPRVAVCDLDVDITNLKSPPPGGAAKPAHPLRLRVKYVVTQEGKGWVIVSGQSTEWKGAAGK